MCFVVNIENSYTVNTVLNNTLWPLIPYCFNINQINQEDLGFEVLLHLLQMMQKASRLKKLNEKKNQQLA